MTADALADELVIAKILAGANVAGRTFARGLYGVFSRDSHTVCAIGAGVLYAGQDAFLEALSSMHTIHTTTPISFFAEHFGVSREYAGGVFDGFESLSLDFFKSFVSDALYDDYLRGYAVGAAVFAATVRRWTE